MSKVVITVTSKLHVGFGGNREELKEEHTGKKKKWGIDEGGI